MTAKFSRAIVATSLLVVWFFVNPSVAISTNHSPSEVLQEYDSLNIHVSSGWNMISIPLLVVDPRIQTLFPTAVSPAFAYQEAYVQRDTVRYGESYWLKFQSEDTILIRGTSPIIEVISLRVGWNMIAAPSKTTLINNLQFFPGGMTHGDFYTSVPGVGYSLTDTLIPGNGYWVKVNANGNVSTSKWEPLGLQEEIIISMASHPRENNTLLVGSQSDLSAQVFGKLFKTTNAGITWETLLSGGSVRDILFDPDHPDTIYILGGTVSKSTDAGVTWEEKSDGIITNFETFVQSIAIDPQNPNILFAGTGGFFGGGLYKSTNGGTNWINLTITNDTLRNGVVSIEVDPVNSNTVYAGTAGAGYLLKSTDGGDTWSTTGLGETGSMIDMIKADPRIPNTLYAGVRFKGFFISRNNGVSWEKEIVNDSGADGYLDMIFYPSALEKTLATSKGYYITYYNTHQWNEVSQGLPHRFTFANSSSADSKILYIGLVKEWNTIGGVYTRKIQY